MRRAALASLILLLALPPGPAGAQSAEPVEVGDWTYAGESATTVMFIKPQAASAEGLLRVLVRFEEAIPFERRGFASMSNVEIDDVDCAGGRTRMIENTRYSDRNMMGQAKVETVDEPAWRTEAKGSFGAAILAAACGDIA